MASIRSDSKEAFLTFWKNTKISTELEMTPVIQKALSESENTPHRNRSVQSKWEIEMKQTGKECGWWEKRCPGTEGIGGRQSCGTSSNGLENDSRWLHNNMIEKWKQKQRNDEWWEGGWSAGVWEWAERKRAERKRAAIYYWAVRGSIEVTTYMEGQCNAMGFF